MVGPAGLAEVGSPADLEVDNLDPGLVEGIDLVVAVPRKQDVSKCFVSTVAKHDVCASMRDSSADDVGDEHSCRMSLGVLAVVAADIETVHIAAVHTAAVRMTVVHIVATVVVVAAAGNCNLVATVVEEAAVCCIHHLTGMSTR